MTERERQQQQWPADEPEPTAEELRDARALGLATDALLASGEVSRPGDVADELTDAAMLRASLHPRPLARERQDALIVAALDQAPSLRSRRAGQARTAVRHGRTGFYLAMVGLAASVLLAVAISVIGLHPGERSALEPATTARNVSSATRPSEPPARMLSRPSNDLLGRPIRDKGAARKRIDRLFASRLDGYREAMFIRWRPR